MKLSINNLLNQKNILEIKMQNQQVLSLEQKLEITKEFIESLDMSFREKEINCLKFLLNEQNISKLDQIKQKINKFEFLKPNLDEKVQELCFNSIINIPLGILVLMVIQKTAKNLFLYIVVGLSFLLVLALLNFKKDKFGEDKLNILVIGVLTNSFGLLGSSVTDSLVQKMCEAHFIGIFAISLFLPIFNFLELKFAETSHYVSCFIQESYFFSPEHSALTITAAYIIYTNNESQIDYNALIIGASFIFWKLSLCKIQQEWISLLVHKNKLLKFFSIIYIPAIIIFLFLIQQIQEDKTIVDKISIQISILTIFLFNVIPVIHTFFNKKKYIELFSYQIEDRFTDKNLIIKFNYFLAFVIGSFSIYFFHKIQSTIIIVILIILTILNLIQILIFVNQDLKDYYYNCQTTLYREYYLLKGFFINVDYEKLALKQKRKICAILLFIITIPVILLFIFITISENIYTASYIIILYLLVWQFYNIIYKRAFNNKDAQQNQQIDGQTQYYYNANNLNLLVNSQDEQVNLLYKKLACIQNLYLNNNQQNLNHLEQNNNIVYPENIIQNIQNINQGEQQIQNQQQQINLNNNQQNLPHQAQYINLLGQVSHYQNKERIIQQSQFNNRVRDVFNFQAQIQRFKVLYVSSEVPFITSEIIGYYLLEPYGCVIGTIFVSRGMEEILNVIYEILVKDMQDKGKLLFLLLILEIVSHEAYEIGFTSLKDPNPHQKAIEYLQPTILTEFFIEFLIQIVEKNFEQNKNQVDLELKDEQIGLLNIINNNQEYKQKNQKETSLDLNILHIKNYFNKFFETKIVERGHFIIQYQTNQLTEEIIQGKVLYDYRSSRMEGEIIITNSPVKELTYYDRIETFSQQILIGNKPQLKIIQQEYLKKEQCVKMVLRDSQYFQYYQQLNIQDKIIQVYYSKRNDKFEISCTKIYQSQNDLKYDKNYWGFNKKSLSDNFKLFIIRNENYVKQSYFFGYNFFPVPKEDLIEFANSHYTITARGNKKGVVDLTLEGNSIKKVIKYDIFGRKLETQFQSKKHSFFYQLEQKQTWVYQDNIINSEGHILFSYFDVNGQQQKISSLDHTKTLITKKND